MTKRLPHLILICLLIALLCPAIPRAYAAPEPEYAKWGRLAVQETQKQYKADIIDYLHVGRKRITTDVSEEVFRLWLQERSGKQFAVIARVRFDHRDDRLLSIRLTRAASGRN